MNGYEPPNIDARPSPDCRFVKSLAELDGLAALTPPAEDKPKGRDAKRKTADRFGVLNSFVDAGMVALKPVEQSVWFVLWRECRNGLAICSQADIARRIGVSDRTVRRAIDRLRKLGFVRIARRGNLRKGPSSYAIQPLPK